MGQEKSKISINISCYNRSEMLRECIESFLDQDFDDFEIIVVDDGSEEDLSFVLFMDDMDDRIKYYHQEHGGMAKGLNLAFQESSGTYIMPFGSDDLANPGFLSKMVEHMENNHDFDVVYCDCWTMDQNGKKKRHMHPYYKTQEEAYRQMLTKQYISHGGTLWKKEHYPTYDETVGSAEDWEFFLTAMENGTKFKFYHDRLWTYRVGHPRESMGKGQNDGCEKVLARRGYTFDLKTRQGKPCN